MLAVNHVNLKKCNFVRASLSALILSQLFLALMLYTPKIAVAMVRRDE